MYHRVIQKLTLAVFSETRCINIFVICLDKYWSHHPLQYYFKAKITGTDHSKCDIEV